MLDTAKHSLPMKRQKKYKTHKPKKWFNKECEKARKMFKKAANNANRNPLSSDLNKETSENSKNSRKSVKSNNHHFGIQEIMN